MSMKLIMTDDTLETTEETPVADKDDLINTLLIILNDQTGVTYQITADNKDDLEGIASEFHLVST
ncbi:hypothetical protein LCGC14_0175180 [marine sediment metagenome]|uniref:Uncharacterized protein n=1 Tax=marine sediment metagenome TaxID=412755 RepID=A0A0F9UV81_9ZZZZ